MSLLLGGQAGGHPRQQYQQHLERPLNAPIKSSSALIPRKCVCVKAIIASKEPGESSQSSRQAQAANPNVRQSKTTPRDEIRKEKHQLTKRNESYYDQAYVGVYSDREDDALEGKKRTASANEANTVYIDGGDAVLSPESTNRDLPNQSDYAVRTPDYQPLHVAYLDTPKTYNQKLYHMIKNCVHHKQMEQLIDRHGRFFTAVNVGQAVLRTASMPRILDQDTYQALSKGNNHVLPFLRPVCRQLAVLYLRKLHKGKMDFRTISHCLIGFARMRYFQPEVFGLGLKAAVRMGYQEWPAGLQQLILACAVVGYQEPGVMDRLANMYLDYNLQTQFQELNHTPCDKFAVPVNELASVVWSFASLNHYHEHLYNRIASDIIDRAHLLTARSLTSVMYAYSAMGVHVPQLYEALLEQLPVLLQEHHMSRFSVRPGVLNTLMWSMGNINYQGDLYDSISSFLCERVSAGHLKLCPGVIANILMSYSSSRNFNHNLYALLLDETKQVLPDFTPRNLSCTLWAMSYYYINCGDQYKDVQLLHAASDQLKARLSYSAESRNQGDGVHGDEGQGGGGDEAVRVQVRANVRDKSFTASELANLMWCFARAEHVDPELVEMLLTESVEAHMSTMTPTQFAWIIIGANQMRYPFTQDQLFVVGDIITELAARADALGIVKLAHAAHSLQLLCERGLVDALGQRMGSVVEGARKLFAEDKRELSAACQAVQEVYGEGIELGEWQNMVDAIPEVEGVEGQLHFGFDMSLWEGFEEEDLGKDIQVEGVKEFRMRNVGEWGDTDELSAGLRKLHKEVFGSDQVETSKGKENE